MVFVKYKKSDLQNAFQLEATRSKLAKENNYLILKELYLEGSEEIPNNNFPKLWDLLNLRKPINKSNNPMGWERLSYVVNQLNNTLKVLDIGFGSGDLENILFKIHRKIDLSGIDISDKSVKRIQKKFPLWNFKVGDIKSLEFQDKSFDYLIALEVLEHIPPSDLFVSLKEIHRVLKNNGILILSIPINEGLEELLDKGINPNAHVRVYTESLIQAELKISNFYPISTKKLYAFNNYYSIKSIFSKIFPFIKSPNNLIIKAKKI